jgi:hypothetical protein
VLNGHRIDHDRVQTAPVDQLYLLYYNLENVISVQVQLIVRFVRFEYSFVA